MVERKVDLGAGGVWQAIPQDQNKTSIEIPIEGAPMFFRVRSGQ